MREQLVDTVSPYLDMKKTMPRTDEVSTIQRMLADARTSTVVLIGEEGTGKSTLAFLLYYRFLKAKEAGQAAPHFLVWLSISTYTTFSDILFTLLDTLHVQEPDFSLMTPAQQISILLQALRRMPENALIVLDQFEQLFQADTPANHAASSYEHELASLFLELLRANLGNSRILLTNHGPVFQQAENQESTIRSYFVPPITIQEGTALLQHYGIDGSSKELSMVWQRCEGHVLTLVLFCAIVHIGHVPPANLLLANEYQWAWQGAIPRQLITLLHSYLSPMQRHLLRALSLFDEPVPTNAIIAAMSDEKAPITYLYENQPFMNLFEHELQMLVQLSIVQVASWSQQDARFTLHPLLHQYVLEQHATFGLEQGHKGTGGQQALSLGVSGPLNTFREHPESQRIALAAGHKQVASYYYALMREACPPRERRTGIQDVIPLISTIRHLCLSYQWQVACDLLFTEDLHTCLPHWGAWHTLAMLYTSFLPPLGALQRRDEGLVASLLATLYGQHGDYEQSQKYFDYALKAQREISDMRGEAVTLANRGELCRLRSELSQAQHYFEQAIALQRKQTSETSQDVHLKCIVLHNMGLLYHEQKNYGAAFNCYVHSLRLAYTLQEQHDKGTILTNLGLLLYEQGRLREAFAVLLAALRLRQTLQDPGTTTLTRFLLGVEQKMGTETYKQLCREALATQKEVFSQLLMVNVMA